MRNKESKKVDKSTIQTTEFIEFIGPSSIGKTTFLKELVELRGKENDWVSNLEIQVAYFQNNLVGKIKKGVDYLLNNNTRKKIGLERLKKYEEDCSLIISLLYDGLHHSGSLSWRKVGLHDYVIHSVLQRMIGYSEMGFSKIVLDEGLVHNGGITAVTYNLEKYKKLTESSLFPVAVVAFKLDPEEYKERILQRFKENKSRKINSLYDDMSDTEIHKFIDRTLERAKSKEEACKQLNLPLLKVTAEPNSENLKKVHNFILNPRIQIS